MALEFAAKPAGQPRRKANRIKGWQSLDNQVAPFTQPEKGYDGSKLTSQWNDEVFTQQQSTAPHCARLHPCQSGTCKYHVSCDKQTLQPPRNG